MTSTPLPDGAVVRVSRGGFDPALFAEIQATNVAVGRYLAPAIRELPSVISYYAGVSPEGSIVHVSTWDSEEHARQMGRLKEMIVDARNDYQKAGVSFNPSIVTPLIVNHPIDWAV